MIVCSLNGQKAPLRSKMNLCPWANDYSEERTEWIAKVLRQITKIEPGMKRQELLKVFTTEGVRPLGFSARTSIPDVRT
jgi:hypothetical protein